MEAVYKCFPWNTGCVCVFLPQPSSSPCSCMIAAPLLVLLPIYQRALLFVSESTQHNYKTSGAFNLLLISQQLWWKALGPINVSKHDPTMSRPPHNPINIREKTGLEIDLPQWQRFNFYKLPNKSKMCQMFGVFCRCRTSFNKCSCMRQKEQGSSVSGIWSEDKYISEKGY